MSITKNTCCSAETDGENFADAANNCFSPFEYTCTNIWSNNFSSPEISCDMEILHSDLMEIKALVSEIRDCIKSFFSES